MQIGIRENIENAGRLIDNDALMLASGASQGYPYLIQLIGYNAWEQNPSRKTITLKDVELSVEVSKHNLIDSIYAPTLKRLSPKDKEFLSAMAQDAHESKMSDIQKRLGASANYLSQYRIRLIDSGIIAPTSRGFVTFAVPYLKDYLSDSTR